MPEPGKIEVDSTQAYLVYDLGFGVPETKPDQRVALIKKVKTFYTSAD
ncbi:hypothetical protein LYNGBM3L_25230 [Moorena producens 3L]|uniref:Uncharacterized protein n=1 Tax=Moorena producens 3L TaxID=489825 RepID=F4XNS9_9CYAN|nr:hypothetical protein LYNGBM3L_25230 [Moorena producens 3L]